MLDYTVNINRINKWIFSKMKESEKSKYDKNLNLYSEIVKKRILTRDFKAIVHPRGVKR